MSSRGRLIAIGNFDGVHLGHRHLLTNLVQGAERRGLVPTVLTFDPHPALVLGRGQPRTLTPLARKVALLTEVDARLQVLVQPFDLALSKSSPRAFAELLVREHGAVEVVVGQNFRFGKDRAGSLDTLRSLGRELGFGASATELLSLDGEVVSSSRVRDAVARGDLELATRLLGRPHRVSGRVVPGDGRGRGLGFPTANLADTEELLPLPGVYAVRVVLAPERLHRGVVNLGVRPTFGHGALRLEVHVLDHEGDLSGRVLGVDFVTRLREERRFESPAELRAQLLRDVESARTQLGP